MEEIYIIGTCETMCPLNEAELRQKENLLHIFEMKKGTEYNQRPEYDLARMVKSFSRSAAGVKTANPSNLRPFPVLLKTVRYLCLEIFPLHKEKPLLVYNFMFDRFRAIRQDAVIQNLSSAETVKILEPIVKFLIYFSYILAEKDISEFDSHINNTHLQECMKRLLVCYNELEEDNSPNRWEIESAYLLFNLGNIKSLTRGVSLCEPHSDENYLYCLKLSLQCNSVPEIRKYTLKSLCYAYSSVNSAYPIHRLQSLLLYDKESQVVNDCKSFNIKISQERVNFSKKDFDSSGKCKEGIRCKWVDDKLVECDLVKLLYS